MKSQRGFSLVGFLVLLPMLLSVVILVAGAMTLLTTDAELKHECRTTLLEAQEENAKDLEQLMELNDLAKSLRDARSAAEATVRVAVFPPAAAAARAALAAVVAKQTALAAKQTALIFRAKSRSRTSPLKAKLKLHRKLRDHARFVDARDEEMRTRIRHGEFDLVRSPKDSLTPDYRPAADFSERQETSVEAEWSVTTLLPAWIRKWLGRDDLKMTTACRATVAKGKEGWRSLLKADKS